MTNRKTYTVFWNLDDPEILTKLEESNASNRYGVMVVLGSKHFEMKLRENSLGTFLCLYKLGKENCIYGQYVSRDCENIEAFLKLAKRYLNL